MIIKVLMVEFGGNFNIRIEGTKNVKDAKAQLSGKRLYSWLTLEANDQVYEINTSKILYVREFDMEERMPF